MIVSDIAILKALPGRLASLAKMRAEVGVFKDTNARSRMKTKAELTASGKNLAVGASQVSSVTVADRTNAEIGYIHEYGQISAKIPQRSFLRTPLETKGDQLASDGLLEAIEDALSGEGNAKNVGHALAAAAEGIIDDAFETGGFGTWEALKEKTVARKGSNKILVESSQLQGAITHRIV